MPILADRKNEYIATVTTYDLDKLEFLSTKKTFDLEVQTKHQAAVVATVHNERLFYCRTSADQ
jgi:hypothetical protein